MKEAAAKTQLVRELDAAAYSLGKTVTSSAVIRDGEAAAGLPDAFAVVAEGLPVLLRSLRGMEANLKATGGGKESKEAKEKYDAALQLAEACKKGAGYLEDLFAAVTPQEPGEAVGKRMERYREAVDERNGEAVEAVARDLLQRAVDVAAPLLAGDEDLVSELQKALTDVKNVKPTLKKTANGEISMVNYGSGSMFLHKGHGDMNSCSGGVMITGKGAQAYLGKDHPRN